MLTSDEARWVREEERLFNHGLFPMLSAKVAQAEAEAEAEAAAEAEARLRAATATEEVFSRLLAQLFAVRTAPRRA